MCGKDHDVGARIVCHQPFKTCEAFLAVAHSRSEIKIQYDRVERRSGKCGVGFLGRMRDSQPVLGHAKRDFHGTGNFGSVIDEENRQTGFGA